jgi:hypothetical protein
MDAILLALALRNRDVWATLDAGAQSLVPPDES